MNTTIQMSSSQQHQLNESFDQDKLMELLREACHSESLNWSSEMRRNDSNSNSNSSSTDDDLVKSSERDEMVAFLLEVCERGDMQLGLDTFALCCSLLDRFLLSFKVKSRYLECLAVACLYIACKVKEEDERISITSEFLLDCDCKCSVNELLRMELTVLSKFAWNFNDTTSADFYYLFCALLSRRLSSSLTPSTKATTTMIQQFRASYESKLKQCLCIGELSSRFEPHMLAFALLKMEILDHSSLRNNIKCKQFLIEMAQFLKSSNTTLNKSYDMEMWKCEEQVRFHMELLMDAKQLLLEQQQQQQSKSARPLMLRPQLSVIEEATEETADEDMMKKFSYSDMILMNSSNGKQRKSSLSSSGETSSTSSEEDDYEDEIDDKNCHLINDCDDVNDIQKLLLSCLRDEQQFKNVTTTSSASSKTTSANNRHFTQSRND